MSQYDYTKSPCSIDRLTQEIQQSSISVALDYITYAGSALSVFFKATLASGEITTLDALVSAHSGTPLPQNQAQPVSISSALPAFAAKTVVINGATKSLYKRFTGINQSLSSGSNTFTWTQSAYAHVKFLGVEILGAELGDKCDLLVLDTATGTYSGYANYPLNQFAFGAYIAAEVYRYESKYEADLYQNLQIKFVYTSVSAKTIYINFDINEVK